MRRRGPGIKEPDQRVCAGAAFRLGRRIQELHRGLEGDGGGGKDDVEREEGKKK